MSDEMTQEEQEQALREFYESEIKPGIDEVIRFVDNWYYGRCPSRIGNSEFYRYIVNSYGSLVKPIVGRDVKPKIVRAAPTAFTDLENIYISARNFTKEFYESHAILEEDELGKVAVCFNNGLMAHEALHIKKSSSNFGIWADDYIASGRKLPKSFSHDPNMSEQEMADMLGENRLFHHCCNLIEDTYIEAYAKAVHPAHYKFIQLTRDAIAYNAMYRNRILKEFLEERKLDNYLYVIAFLISENYANNIPPLERQIITEEVIEIVERSRDPRLGFSQREEIAFDLFDQLLDGCDDLGSGGEDNKEDENEQSAGKSDNSSDDQKDNQQGKQKQNDQQQGYGEGKSDNSSDNQQGEQKQNDQQQGDCEDESDNSSDDQKDNQQGKQKQNNQQQGYGKGEADGESDDDGEPDETDNQPSKNTKTSDSPSDYQMDQCPNTIDNTNPDDANDIDDLNEEMQEKLHEIAEQIKNAMENQEKSEEKADVRKDFINANKDEIKIDYKDIMNDGYCSWRGIHYGNVDVAPDRCFHLLGNLLRHARAKKSDFGIPDNRGRKISKRSLHRIATDSKILVKRNRKKVIRGEPRVITLLDTSGSTVGSYGDRGYVDLQHTIVCGGFGIHLSLKQAQIPNAVYAHTADDGLSVIRGVASYRMPMNGGEVITTENLRVRFSNVLSMSHQTNADGDAIAHVAKFFPENEGTKIIIVLCDGIPTVYPYFSDHVGYSMGEAWTRENVNELRRQGFVVFCVSLTEGVERANDRIYGTNYNLKAANGLTRKLQSFVYDLGLRY